ncbi:unnamed protein product [Ectocarpus sp. 6 AP-2014]
MSSTEGKRGRASRPNEQVGAKRRWSGSSSSSQPKAPATATCSCKTFHLQSGTGKLRFWPSLLTDAAQRRLFEELTVDPDLRPLDPKVGSGGGGGGGGSGNPGLGEDGAARGRWMQRPIKLFGREIPQPRLTCFYGRTGVSYRYSGKTLEATPWDGVPAIQEILAAAGAAAGVDPGYFNCVLLNWYRDGADYMGWHSDDEKELEKGAAIASVSLGAGRRFQLRRKKDHTQKVEFILGGGSLLLMEGGTQEHWQHRVPKRTAKEEREIRQSPQERREAKALSPLLLSWSGQGGKDSSSLKTGESGGNGSITGGRGGSSLLTSSAGARGGRINLTFRRVKEGVS